MTGHPCGKCVGCFNRRRMEWSTRMMLESVFNKSHAFFVTLTYESVDDYYRDGSKNIQLMCKRIRNAGYDIRYCFTTEFGKVNDRVHHHGIIWSSLPAISWYSKPKESNERFQNKFWQKGFVLLRPILPGKKNPFGYCTKYILKDSPKVIHSNKPRIGDAGIQYMKDYCKKRHAIRPFKSVLEFPSYFDLPVLGHYKKIYMLNTTRNELAKSLDVKFLPAKADSENSLLNLRLSGTDKLTIDTNLLRARSS